MIKKIYCILIFLIVIANVALSSIVLYKITSLQSYFVDESIDLMDSNYYKLHDYTAYSTEQIFALPIERYMVYFYSDNCSSCSVSNEYLAAFIDYGFTSKIDIYFVNVAERDDLLTDNEQTVQLTADEFKVVYTPTMLIFENGNISEYIGSDEVFEILDSYVKR